jgi:hypothetical protein
MAVLLFIKEKFVDAYIVAIDSSILLRAKGSPWHMAQIIHHDQRSSTMFRYRY